ncbi:MAG: anaerobic ribonucleoside-triphosphate reductase activating protein [Candidatus Cloacimonadota bacterium]|jgi:pyruvate formate lyase activating enzyme|nr:anaerobic ribonucleoside-triphosphate reductase activating protein [Candidatus Cloacimonadota bacterium]
MKIGGFQKFSLLDYPGQLAAIIFTQGCNFRCPYCHNPRLVDPQRYGKRISNSKIVEFLQKRLGRLDSVSITGGEPTLQKDLIPFIRMLKKMGYKIKLDTNGSHPEVIEELVAEDLVDYWAMDLKAPAQLYRILTRSEIDMRDILSSMRLLRESGKGYEFRTTFFDLLFTWDDIADIRALLKPGDKFCLQECRYKVTLDNLQPGKEKTGLSEAAYRSLMDHPQSQSLIHWGDENHIDVMIRSL